MRKTWIEKTIGNISMLVILLPGIAYLITYAYKIGFFSFYNIPDELITIGAKDIASMVLLVCCLLFGYFFIDFLIFNFIFKHFFNCYPKQSKVLQDQYFIYCSNILFLFFLIPLCLVCSLPKQILIAFLCFPAFSMLVFLFTHILFLRKKKHNKEIQEAEDKGDKTTSVSSVVERILGIRVFFIILFVLYLYIIALNLGKADASNKRAFYQFDNRSDLIGIAIIGDHVISKYLDDKELKRTEIVDIRNVGYFEEMINLEFVELVKEYNDVKNERRLKKKE